MPDFRFEGMTTSGRSVQGIVQADSFKEAKKKIHQLASLHRVHVNKILKRRTYIFKVSRDGEKPIKGEQKAFSKEEVEEALKKLGYTIHRIDPKVIDFKLKPPASEIVTFVQVCTNLLREKMPFNEVLQLLMFDVQNARLREALKEINNDLRQGKDSEEAFIKQEAVLGKFTSRMLGLASKSGNMASIYESTGKFLERRLEFKRNLKSALIMPLFTLVILMLAIFFYIVYIFPKTATLFVRLGVTLPPMTATTLKVSNFLNDNLMWLILSVLIMVGGIVYFINSPRGKFLIDKYIIRIPVLGTLVHRTTIEIFCRVFYALYSGSGENIDAIRMAAEASGNRYFEHQIRTIAIPAMLSKGRGLVQAFEASGVFTKLALARFRSGAETGTVKATALQIANYYESETSFKLKNTIEFIQLSVAMVITIVVTALTLLSSETAMITPKMPF